MTSLGAGEEDDQDINFLRLLTNLSHIQVGFRNIPQCKLICPNHKALKIEKDIFDMQQKMNETELALKKQGIAIKGQINQQPIVSDGS